VKAVSIHAAVEVVNSNQSHALEVRRSPKGAESTVLSSPVTSTTSIPNIRNSSLYVGNKPFVQANLQQTVENRHSQRGRDLEANVVVASEFRIAYVSVGPCRCSSSTGREGTGGVPVKRTIPPPHSQS
jgi:hypothetical protein